MLKENDGVHVMGWLIVTIILVIMAIGFYNGVYTIIKVISP